MKTYVVGTCKACGCILAAAIKHDEKEWGKDIVEFVESGLMVSRLRTDQRVTVNGHLDWCREKP